jgi:hypothetical protein
MEVTVSFNQSDEQSQNQKLQTQLKGDSQK